MGVDDCTTDGEGAVRFDSDMELAGGDDRRLDQRGDAHRIVNGGAARLGHPLDFIVDLNAMADFLLSLDFTKNQPKTIRREDVLK